MSSMLRTMRRAIERNGMTPEQLKAQKKAKKRKKREGK